MAGLGWQELVIVAALVGVLAVVVLVALALTRARPRRGDGRAQELLYAGFWNRAGAGFIDGVILLIPERVAYALGLALAGGGHSILALVLSGSVWLAYVVAGNGRGATIGKRWVGLRVVDASGAVPGTRRALVRAVIPLGVFVVNSLAVAGRPDPEASMRSGWDVLLGVAVLVGVVDVLWMIRDPRKQTLHDKMAGTFVVVA